MDMVTNIDGKPHIRNADIAVMTEGVVHESEADAWATVKYLEGAYGLVFCEY
jgi:hypothetical protein